MAQSDDKILKFQDAVISDETQQMLNQPLAHPHGLSSEDTAFLTDLMAKIDKGEIQVYRPDTIINYPVYDHLNDQLKAKVDFDAVQMLMTIREIRKLWNLGHRETYQIENLVHAIRLKKEGLEQVEGDVYII